MNIDTLVDDICKRHRHNAVKHVNHKTSFFKFLSNKRHRHNAVKHVNHKTSFFKFLNKHPFYIGNLIGCILAICVCGYSFLLISPFIALSIIYTLQVVLKDK